jgi:transcriptional regulator with XRE-family HTH domain
VIGIELRRERQRAELTGHVVCQRSKLGRSRLSDIERGYVEPSKAEVQRIRSAIRVLATAKTRVAQLAERVGWPM